MTRRVRGGAQNCEEFGERRRCRPLRGAVGRQGTLRLPCRPGQRAHAAGFRQPALAHAPTGDDVFSGQPSSIVRCRKNDGRRYIIRLSYATEWRLADREGLEIRSDDPCLDYYTGCVRVCRRKMSARPGVLDALNRRCVRCRQLHFTLL
jgi:hypothetical protein